jgi:succinate dehydrogenase / fumarate reductase cytochrome b subunit
MSERKRPLSPHLQIYKPQISSISSITHRITGVMLYFTIIAISWYIVYYAYQINISSDSVSCECLLNDILSYFLYAGAIFAVFALYYHFLNGIRHLFWDIGKGFDKEIATRNGIIILVSSVLLTILTIGFFVYFNSI